MKEQLHLLFAITGLLLLVSCGTSKNKVVASMPELKAEKVSVIVQEAEMHPIQIKYGNLLGVDPKEITDIPLYSFVDQWLEAPYKMGGESETGIDCSSFAQRFYVDNYGYLLERTSGRMYKAKSTDIFLGQEYLNEGDILFFKSPNVDNKTITHVGIYLKNNMFVSASGYAGPEKMTGVKLSDLSHKYWQERFISAGRKPISKYSTDTAD